MRALFKCAVAYRQCCSCRVLAGAGLLGALFDCWGATSQELDVPTASVSVVEYGDGAAKVLYAGYKPTEGASAGDKWGG